MSNQTNQKKGTKPIDKGLIFLKSTVWALFVVLIVLMFTLVMLKNKKNKSTESATNDCNQTKTVIIDNEIEEIEEQGRVLNVLTKVNKETNSQELIRIDVSCGNEMNRIHFQITNDNKK